MQVGFGSMTARAGGWGSQGTAAECTGPAGGGTWVKVSEASASRRPRGQASAPMSSATGCSGSTVQTHEEQKMKAISTRTDERQRRTPLHMSKNGSIWRLFVRCLLALGDTVPKCYFLLSFGTPLAREKLPKMDFCPPQSDTIALSTFP